MKIIQQLRQNNEVSSLTQQKQQSLKGGTKKMTAEEIYIDQGQSSPPRWKDKK